MRFGPASPSIFFSESLLPLIMCLCKFDREFWYLKLPAGRDILACHLHYGVWLHFDTMKREEKKKETKQNKTKLNEKWENLAKNRHF